MNNGILHPCKAESPTASEHGATPHANMRGALPPRAIDDGGWTMDGLMIDDFRDALRKLNSINQFFPPAKSVGMLHKRQQRQNMLLIFFLRPKFVF